MNRVSRRSFFGGSAALVTAAWVTYNYGTTWWSDSGLDGRSLDTRLITMGVNSDLFNGPLKGKRSTLLSEIDFKTGWIKQTQLPIISAHAPSYLPDNSILALSAHESVSLVVDADHKIKQEIKLPFNFVFGGHSLTLEDMGLVAIAIKKRYSDNLTDPGFINFYSLKNFDLVRQVPVPATFAHDLVRVSENQIAISQYGTLNFDFQKTDTPYFDKKLNATLLMQAVRPTLSYLNLKTFEYDQHRILQQFHGLNHITKGKNDEIFAVSVQAVQKDKGGYDFALSKYKDKKIIEQKNIDKSSNDNFFSLPSPLDLIPYDLSKNKIEFMGTPSKQVRSQDLVGDPNLNWVASSFPNSGTVGIIKNNSDLNLIETSNWGAPAPRGLSALPDSGLLGICDQDEGLVVIDVNTLTPVSSAKFKGYRIIHLDSKRV